MILIADSSALITLSICNQLELPEKLFDRIKVPLSVYNEINIPHKPESEVLVKYLKGKIINIDLSPYIISTPSLGKGELEAMALYKKLNADFLLTDDKKARKIAEYNGIKIIGSIGLLIWAKEKNLIEKVKPSLDEIYNSYIFISEDLYHHILKIIDE